MEITFIKKIVFFHKFVVLALKKFEKVFLKEIVRAISFFLVKVRHVISFFLLF